LFGRHGDPSGVVQRSKQFGDRRLETGRDEVRPDIMERVKDKASEVEARMRKRQKRVLRHCRAVVKDVQIEGSGGVFWADFGTAEIALDGLERVQELSRGEGCGHLEDSVDEAWRVRCGIDRIGFVKRRGEDGAGDSVEREDTLTGFGEQCTAVSDV
jgi:hypothetical protein